MYKVYFSEVYNDWCFEAWGASTKHPDRTARMHETEGFTVVNYFDDEAQIFQWLLHLASESTFPFHAKSLAEYALKNWYTFK